MQRQRLFAWWYGLGRFFIPASPENPASFRRRRIALSSLALTLGAFTARASASTTSKELPSSQKRKHILAKGQTIDLRGEDVSLAGMEFEALSGGATVYVGGAIDASVTVVLFGNVVEAGSRKLRYLDLDGALVEDDWLLISGHLDGAWTTNGGRTCDISYLCRVRKVDAISKHIHLYHDIPEGIDDKEVEDGKGNWRKYVLTATKIKPQIVNLAGVRLFGVNLVASYVVNSAFDVVMDSQPGHACYLKISYANNIAVKAVSTSRPNHGGSHTITVNDVYQGTIEVSASAVNYSKFTRSPSDVAKSFRGNGLTHCTVRSQIIAAGIWSHTIHGMVGGRFTAYSADAGTYNIDNGIERGNRNDTNNFVYLRRGAQIDVSAIEFDATGLEIFGAHDSEIIGCNLSKTRSSSRNSDSGMLSIKGICRKLVVRGLRINAQGDLNQAVRLEFHDLHDGKHQEDITFFDPHIQTDGYGFMTRGEHVVRYSSFEPCRDGIKISAIGHQLRSGMRVRLSDFVGSELCEEFIVAVLDKDAFSIPTKLGGERLRRGLGKIIVLFDAKVRVLGGYVKARRPFFFDRNVRDITLSGTLIEIADGSKRSGEMEAGHAVTVLGGDATLANLVIRGTAPQRRHAIASEGPKMTVCNVNADGGFFVHNNLEGTFNPGIVQNINMAVHLQGSKVVLTPTAEGSFSVGFDPSIELSPSLVRDWPKGYVLKNQNAKTCCGGWVLEKNHVWSAIK